MVNAQETVNTTAAPSGRAEPAELLTISNLDTLRLLADPLRMRLMSLLADARDGALTVKQLATTLGVRPTRLYYHVNLLEEHGLLQVASSRVVSGIVEKSYTVAARSITVDPALLRVSPAGLEATAATVTSLMQATAIEIGEGLELAAAKWSDPEARQMRIGKSGAHLTEAAHAEFLKRLNELIDDFEDKYGSSDNVTPNRALFVAYYPLISTGERTDQ